MLSTKALVERNAIVPRNRDANTSTARFFSRKTFRNAILCSFPPSVPFLGLIFADPRILDYVFNVPWEYKYSEGCEKKLLREAMKDYVPHEIMYRKKSPYPKSYDPHYEQELAKRLLCVLNDPESPLLPLIDREYVKNFINAPKDYGRPWFGQLMAGPQMMAYLLQIDHWLRKYAIVLDI